MGVRTHPNLKHTRLGTQPYRPSTQRLLG